MPLLRVLTFLLCTVVVTLTSSPAGAGKPVRILTSFSILGDIVKNIGGDRVEVTTLVGADSDVHAYSPTPAAVRAVSQADLVVVNGLGLEGWMERLIKASGFKGEVVTASRDVSPRRMKDDGGKTIIDPHAWQSLANGRRYVHTIETALETLDPDGATDYKVRAADYDRQLAALDGQIAAEFATIPKDQRRMITTHDAFGYLADAYGIDILSPMGVSTDSEPSAQAVKELIGQIRRQKITAVFVENISDPRLIQQIARESGVTVGGELFSDALSLPTGKASTYLAMFRYNTEKIIAAMRSGQ